MTTVYIVRHCEAMGNVIGVFQGNTDFDISEKGKRQLDKLSERFKSIRLDAAYSSPLRRAYATAEACVKHSNISITVDDRLAEINGGSMEGKSWEKLDVLFPVEYSFWKNNFADFSAPEGESVRDVYGRISDSFINIINKNKGNTIGIFSHGCAIRILMCFIKGIPIERIDEVLWSDNTAITCVVIDDYGKMKIKFENDYSHIKNDSSTEANHMWWGEQK